MKHMGVALIFSVISFLNGFSQGLFKNAYDYENNILSYHDEYFPAVIKADLVFKPTSVKVKSEGEKMFFYKADVYGYRNKRNEDFRFFNDKSYRIVSNNLFYIYSREENSVNGKVKTRETRYYFSKDSDSPIFPLTKNNLRYVFPMSRDFHDQLDVYFDNDRDLMKYDHFYKEYKVEGLVKRTVK